jgi:EAL and modified HD-GYP domain-containing signal transduction protein
MGMDIYIARQPIFDRYMKVHGYELLYRQGNTNSFTGLDDDLATAELLYNSFMVMGLKDLTSGTLAFINFSKGLIASEIPFLLPPAGIVVEVLERDEATEVTVEACKRLREKGYKIALDDFIPTKENFPLFEYADIIKVEYPAVSLEDQRELIKRYGAKKTFLAEKIETREEYRQASDLGYQLFQGYFFSKPALISSKEIGTLLTNVYSILEELNRPDPSYEVIAEHIGRDLGLSYKLLKLVNSVYYGPLYKIKTIKHALAHLGIRELHRWFSIMLLKDMRNVENAEMIKLSLVRAKLMELLAGELYDPDENMNCFFAGLFSSIDALLNRPMQEIMAGLPLSERVKQALLGENNEYRELLNCVIASESGSWDRPDNSGVMLKIGAGRFTALYLESLKWAQTLNY